MPEKLPSYNLITYVKAFYFLGFHSVFKSDQQSIYWALLYKFNSLRYPDKIRISNKELAGLTNIPIRTLYRYRDNWNEYRHLDTEQSWIIKYESGKTREYGIYEMNFRFLNVLMPKDDENGINDIEESGLVSKTTQNGANNKDDNQSANGLMPKTNDFAEELQISGKKSATNLQNAIENGTPSYTILDNTKQDYISPPTNLTTSDNNNPETPKENKKENYYDVPERKLTDQDIEESQKDEQDEERFQKFKTLFKQNCTAFNIGGGARARAFRKILEYPDEKITKVVEKAGLKGKNSGDILDYVMNGLQNYDTWYAEKDNGDNGYDPKKHAEAIEAERQKRLSEFEQWKKDVADPETVKKTISDFVKQLDEKEEQARKLIEDD